MAHSFVEKNAKIYGRWLLYAYFGVYGSEKTRNSEVIEPSEWVVRDY